MTQMPDVLINHGLAVLFAWAFAVQAGVPAPAVPMLVGAGALSGSGHLDLARAIAAAAAATLGADVLWYSVGRSQGSRLLGLLCRFSLNPDSLVRHAEAGFAAHRARYLIVAKFLPGANPLAAGLAGVVSTPLDVFLFFATAGALLWAGAWITLGYFCADIIGPLVARAAHFGGPLLIAVAAALILYVGFKHERRRRSLPSSPKSSPRPGRGQATDGSRR